MPFINFSPFAIYLALNKQVRLRCLGLTPEIRDACAIFNGLTSANFSRASVAKLSTLL